MTTRELARSLNAAPSDINSVLLKLQEKGLVKFGPSKWKSNVSRAELAPNVSSRTLDEKLPDKICPQAATKAQPWSTLETPRSTAGAVRPRIDRKNSRWSTFRRLCDYYAECVRLDQGVSINSKAEDEFENIVCLDGALPDTTTFNVRTRKEWHKWSRKVAEDNYLFIGYPLHRFHWDGNADFGEVDFISPVFIRPCRVNIAGIEMELEAIGPIRINEGWLEKRIKNVPERRKFVELCGFAATTDDSVNDPTWADCARLLNHFYPDWCNELLNPNNVNSTPRLELLDKNGVYNRAALIVPKRARFVANLFDELLELANDVPDESLDKTALAHLFPHIPPASAATVRPQESENPLAKRLIGSQVLSLNFEQTVACQAAATASHSIVIGPPGTGKSRVVVAALGQQAILGKSALFASRNHQAIEAVVPRINAITEPWTTMLRLSTPWGTPMDASLPSALNQLLGASNTNENAFLERLRLAAANRIQDFAGSASLLAKISELRERLRFYLFALAEETRLLDDKFRERAMKHSHSIPDPKELEAAQQLLTDLPRFQFSVKWFKAWFLHRGRMKQGISKALQVDQVMRAVFDPKAELPNIGVSNQIELAKFCSEILKFWRPLSLVNQTTLEVSRLREQLSGLPAIEDACDKHIHARKELQDLCSKLLIELAQQTGTQITEDERVSLANVLAAINNRSELDSEYDNRRWSSAMQKAFPIFLKHFPLIASTNLSIRRNVDLQPAVFDLLILDEASQCDIASVIPLLYRAGRVMIVGDPMQLSHVNKLSAAIDRHLRRQFQVDAEELERFSYRTTSMFHLANTSKTVQTRTTLREHHRCHPTIAEYCSETFYKGSWTVLTNNDGKQGLKWTHLEDDSKSVAGGGSVSDLQVTVICREIERLCNEGFLGTVGIVTPFRQQANRIRDAVFQNTPKDFINQSKLLIDTADGFQGDERDLVILSLVGGDSLPKGSMTFLANSPNRFNVAVSRAKQLLHVLGDLNWARNSTISHIRELAKLYDKESNEWQRNTELGFRRDLMGPVWEPALADAMQKAGIEFFQQYPTCGRYLDFAILRGELKLNVEVDGETYHRDSTGQRISADLQRDQVLIANGWKILRFWVYELREDMERCLEKIKATILTHQNK